MQIIGAEDHIDPWIFGLDRVNDMLLLHHTAADADSKVLPHLHFFLFELSEGAKKPFICIFPYATGIKDDNVRVFAFRCRLVALSQQHACQRFRVMLVHLTAKSGNMECFVFYQCCSPKSYELKISASLVIYKMIFSFLRSLPIRRSIASAALTLPWIMW